jgi:hypothetical protein
MMAELTAIRRSMQQAGAADVNGSTTGRIDFNPAECDLLDYIEQSIAYAFEKPNSKIGRAMKGLEEITEQRKYLGFEESPVRACRRMQAPPPCALFVL